MHSISKLVLSSSIALLAGCGSGDPVNGTWNQPDGTIDIPQALGGGTVSTNNTLVFDDAVSPSTFTLKMDLSFSSLTDTLQAHGTYAVDGKSVTLTFTGFDVAQGSGDQASIGENGSQCITLNALAGATVCFQAQQAQSFAIANDVLTIAITNEIVGGAMAPTTLTLKRIK